MQKEEKKVSKEIRGSERIKRLYNRLNSAENYVDIQRARYFTESFKQTGDDAINVRFAKALLHTVKNMKLYIEEDQLFAGQIGGPERYGILYPELDACFFGDLKSVLSNRKEATFALTEEDRRYLAEEVAPFWSGKTYYEDFAASLPTDLLRLTYDPEDTKKSRFLINETQSMNSATQWVHDYSIGLNRGFEAIRQEALQNLKDLNREDFKSEEDHRLTAEYLESSAIVCEAVITLASRYSSEAERRIDPKKDLDGISPINMAKVYSGDESGFAPCTAQAVIEALKYENIELAGKNVTVIGRSLVIGKPVAMLLIKENATVTVCHTKTKDLAEKCRNADIIVAAAGKARMVGEDFVSEGQIVADVGINVDSEGNMCGDVDFDKVVGKTALITPVPGGIGSITTSVLMQHLLMAASNQ